VAITAGQIIRAADLAWDSAAVNLTNDAASTTGTWEQWGTETIQFADPGTNVLVKAWITGRLNNLTDANVQGAARVSISLDGGATFIGGQSFSVSVGTSVSPFATYAATNFASGVPTGDIIIKGELLSTGSTATLYESGKIMADVFPQ
jgi:hypothetical protein